MMEAIDEVIDTTPATRTAFDADKLVRSHVLRQIQIIGEAAWRLSVDLKERHPEVPWKLMAGMRHALVHGYFEIDWNEVYVTARRDIPALKPLVRAMLRSLPAEQP
jgi:uncharacterized protein with HEPN domain